MRHPVVTGTSVRSRQKNCNHCVLIKRRCDRRAPCGRCLERKISCVYGRVPNRRDDHHPSDALETNTNALSQALDDDPFSDLTQSIATEPFHDYLMDATPEGMLLDPLLSLLDNDPTLPEGQGQWLVQAEQEVFSERPNTPIDEEVSRSYGKMSHACDEMNSWHLYDPKSTLNFIVTRVRGFIKDVATHNAAPFLHRYLYRSTRPQCILSVFTVSVLYQNRTPGNAVMVMQAIHRGARELVQSATHRATPTEKLARTQALFLYQIIRLLDGDIQLRAKGEDDMPLLVTWLDELRKVRDNLGDVASLETSLARLTPPQEWERWIFAESVRRTIMIALSFVDLYERMKGVEADGDWGAWAYAHRWTLSRHLWEADSTFAFNRAWSEKPHFIITNYSFDTFLKYGRGTDVDEFAEILLSIYMGLDEAKEFLPAKNAS